MLLEFAIQLRSRYRTWSDSYWKEVLCLNPGTLYETCHLIECKNWNKPVGTDEVFKVAGKMEKLALASGTIVAREFTRDAEVLAAQSRKLFLHHFADHFWSALDHLQCAATTSKAEAGQVTFNFREKVFPVLEYAAAKCRFRNRKVDLDGFVSELICRHLQTIINGDTRFRFDGLHTGHTAFSCPFGPKELFVNGHAVEAIFLASFKGASPASSDTCGCCRVR